MDVSHFSPFISSIFPQAGTQISLADLPFSNEIFMLWYNLLPSKQMPCEKNEEEKEAPVVHSEEPGLGPIDLVSHLEGSAARLRGSSAMWVPAVEASRPAVTHELFFLFLRPSLLPAA